MTTIASYDFDEIPPLQINSMEDKLRHSLWNLVEELFDELYDFSKNNYDRSTVFNDVLDVYWQDFHEEPAHLLKEVIRAPHKVELIRKEYYALSWKRVYAFIKFTAKLLDTFMKKRAIKFREDCNYVLEKKNSAFRFIGNELAPITSAAEIDEIQISIAQKDEASVHLSSALTLLSNQDKDQSRESIAQSISAIEAIAKKVTGQNDATLAELCKPKYNLPVHPQFRQAIHNLYNYSSGKESAVRHALTDESQPVNKYLARFMLVISSAFVNLIRAEASTQKTSENAP